MNAREFCIMAHEGQKRKYSGRPFSDHPIAVASILFNNDYSTPQEVTDAAHLHDVLEDTKYTVHDLREEGFSEITIGLVVECTNIYSKMPWSRAQRKHREVNRIKTISTEAQNIKLADSIHNMQDFITQDPDFARRIYLPEKRILLDTALKLGDTSLWREADKIITGFYSAG